MIISLSILRWRKELTALQILLSKRFLMPPSWAFNQAILSCFNFFQVTSSFLTFLPVNIFFFNGTWFNLKWSFQNIWCICISCPRNLSLSSRRSVSHHFSLPIHDPFFSFHDKGHLTFVWMLLVMRHSLVGHCIFWTIPYYLYQIPPQSLKFGGTTYSKWILPNI